MFHAIGHFLGAGRTVGLVQLCKFCREKREFVLPSVVRQREGLVDKLFQLRRSAVSDTSAHNERFIKMLRDRPFIEEVEIVLEDDPCLPCRQQSLRVAAYELPVLPWVRCVKREGCACWYKPIDQFLPGATPGWANTRPMQSSP